MVLSTEMIMISGDDTEIVSEYGKNIGKQGHNEAILMSRSAHTRSSE
jgi:hypothetical protein